MSAGNVKAAFQHATPRNRIPGCDRPNSNSSRDPGACTRHDRGQQMTQIPSITTRFLQLRHSRGWSQANAQRLARESNTASLSALAVNSSHEAGVFRLSRLLSPDYCLELSKRCSRYQRGQCASAITKRQPHSLHPRVSLRWNCCASIRGPLSVKTCEGPDPRLRLHSQRQTSAFQKVRCDKWLAKN